MKKYLKSYIDNKEQSLYGKSLVNYIQTSINEDDAAYIYGVSPYMGEYGLYKMKNNENEIIDYINSQRKLKLGTGKKLINFVAKEFTNITGKKVRALDGNLRNDTYPFATGKVNKYLINEDGFLLCYIKNSHEINYWQDNVPIEENIKCQHLMAITGAKIAYIAILFGDENIIVKEVFRDEETINVLMEKEKIFYENSIKNNIAPMLSSNKDNLKNIEEKYESNALLLYEKESTLDYYDSIIDKIKVLESKKKIIEKNIKDEMKDYEVAFIGNRKIVNKTTTRKIIDVKRLKEEQPELAKIYTKTTTTKVFKIN